MYTTLDEAGRYVLSSGKDRIAAVLGLHALQVTENHLSNGSELLRLISLAMPTVPFAYQSGMNWEDCVALHDKRRGRALAGALVPYLGCKTQRVIMRHALHPTLQRLQLHATLVNPPADLPQEIEFTLEPVRGITSLTARFNNNTLTFTQTSSTGTLPNGDAI